jgi:ABC-type polysaccharide/polyol phosphate export permease
MAMFNQLVSLALLIALLLVTGRLGPGVLGLPLVVVLQTGLLVGVVMVLAPLALVLPDIGYFVNLFTVLLLFVSPIGFRAEMVPSHWRFVVTLNPVTYLIEAYRAVLLGNRPASPVSILVFAALCLTAFSLGSAFFQRFKDVLVDFE